MSTYADLRADVEREQMLDRCEALHGEAGIVDDDCPGCEERAQIALEDDCGPHCGRGIHRLAHCGICHGEGN